MGRCYIFAEAHQGVDHVKPNSSTIDGPMYIKGDSYFKNVTQSIPSVSIMQRHCTQSVFIRDVITMLTHTHTHTHTSFVLIKYVGEKRFLSVLL